MGFNGVISSGYVNSLLLNMGICSIDRHSEFSHEKMVIFDSYVAVYQKAISRLVQGRSKGDLAITKDQESECG